MHSSEPRGHAWGRHYRGWTEKGSLHGHRQARPGQGVHCWIREAAASPARMATYRLKQQQPATIQQHCACRALTAFLAVPRALCCRFGAPLPSQTTCMRRRGMKMFMPACSPQPIVPPVHQLGNLTDGGACNPALVHRSTDSRIQQAHEWSLGLKEHSAPAAAMPWAAGSGPQQVAPRTQLASPLREEVTAVVVHKAAPLRHHVFQSVAHLGKRRWQASQLVGGHARQKGWGAC